MHHAPLERQFPSLLWHFVEPRITCACTCHTNVPVLVYLSPHPRATRMGGIAPPQKKKLPGLWCLVPKHHHRMTFFSHAPCISGVQASRALWRIARLESHTFWQGSRESTPSLVYLPPHAAIRGGVAPPSEPFSGLPRPPPYFVVGC